MEDDSKSTQVIRCIKDVKDSIKNSVHRRYRDLNVTGPQGMLIGILIHHGKMNVSEIGLKLGLSNSTVSGILDRLEKQKMVERLRSEDDRRVVYVNLTEDFRKVTQDRFKEVEKGIEEKINRSKPEELDKIIEGLITLKKLLDE